MRKRTRREWLRVCGGVSGLTAMAGCLGSDGGSQGNDSIDPTAEGTDEMGSGETGTEPLPDPSQPDGWTMYGANPAATGHQSKTTGPSGAVSERWRFDPDVGRHQFRVSPLIRDGSAYVSSSDGRMWALSMDDGTIQWETGFDDHLSQTPIVRGDRLFVQNGTKMSALDRPSGEPQWEVELEYLVHTPHPYDSDVVVVVESNDGCELVRLDAEDGTKEVITEFSATSFAEAVARVGNTLYLIHGASVEALALPSGERRWLWENPHGDKMTQNDVSTDGTNVYATSRAYDDTDRYDRCYAISGDTGEQQWSYESERPYLPYPPAVGNGRVFLVGEKTWAFDATSGEVLWTSEAGGDLGTTHDPPTLAKPAVADGIVYCNRGSVAYALDTESGETVWTHDVPGGSLSTAVHDGIALLGSSYGGTLIAVEAA